MQWWGPKSITIATFTPKSIAMRSRAEVLVIFLKPRNLMRTQGYYYVY